MKRITKYIAILVVALLSGMGLYFLWDSGFFAAMQSQETMTAYLSRFARYPYFVFFLLQFLSVIFAPIPSNLSAVAGGMLFGTWPAFFLTISAVYLASMLLFLLARHYGRPFADRFVSKRLSERYIDLIHSRTTVFLALAFLFPFFPDDLLCILAGLTNISFRRFAVLVVLCRPWGLLFASGLGGASLKLSAGSIIFLVIVGGGALIFGLRYGDRIESYILSHLRRNRD